MFFWEKIKRGAQKLRKLGGKLMPTWDLINWERVADRLRELAQDDSSIRELVEEQMLRAIKELHPKDHGAFMLKYQKELAEIKEGLIKTCSAELRMRAEDLVSGILSGTMH